MLRSLLRALPLCIRNCRFSADPTERADPVHAGCGGGRPAFGNLCQGRTTFPTTSFPVSKAELSRFAAMLAAGANDSVAQDLSEYRRTTLKFETDHDSISAIGDVNLQYTYRSQNVSFDPGLPTELQVMDFHRLFKDGLPLGGIQLDYARDGGFEIGIYATSYRDSTGTTFTPCELPERVLPACSSWTARYRYASRRWPTLTMRTTRMVSSIS